MVFSLNKLYRQNSRQHTVDHESKYALLQHEPPEVDSSDNIKSSPSFSQTPNPTSISPFSVLAVLICIACTTLNWYLSITYPTVIAKNSGLDFRSVSRELYETLQRPSPFIGFDTISRPSPPIPRSLINYPLAIALVNASNPNQVFDDDPKRHLTKTGTVSPEERLVMISNMITTIVQFRAIDYGMERCELNVRIPPSTTRFLTKPTRISVYRLTSSEHPLDTKTLSYSNRPSRLTTVTTISLTPSSTVKWAHEFECAWDSILTFEFAYLSQDANGSDAPENFSIQWWQNKEESNPDHGIFFIQRETV